MRNTLFKQVQKRRKKIEKNQIYSMNKLEKTLLLATLEINITIINQDINLLTVIRLQIIQWILDMVLIIIIVEVNWIMEII